MPKGIIQLGLACMTLAMSLMLEGNSLPRDFSPEPAWPAGYSASFQDIDLQHPERSCTGRFYVNTMQEPQGARWETTCNGRQKISLWRQRYAQHIVLDPERKVYWKPVVHAHVSARIFSENQPAMLDDDSSSRYIGLEQINGRQTKHWEMTEAIPDSNSFVWQYWEDSRLRICFKWIKPGLSTYALTEIREGPQPQDLFEIPTGFHEIPAPKP
jgi:hypothetical protein